MLVYCRTVVLETLKKLAMVNIRQSLEVFKIKEWSLFDGQPRIFYI